MYLKVEALVAQVAKARNNGLRLPDRNNFIIRGILLFLIRIGVVSTFRN